MAVWQAIHRIAGRVGVGLSDRVAMDSFYYDGATIALLAEPGKEMSVEDVLHEICHFVVATKEERLLPEYGMVPRPDVICKGVGSARRGAYTSRVRHVIDQPGRNVRERAAQLVNREFGVRAGVNSVFGWSWERTVPMLEKLGLQRGHEWLASQGLCLEEIAELAN